MGRAAIGMLLCVLAWPVVAGKSDRVHKQVEASMVLAGTVEVDPQGRVSGYAVDKSDEVQPVALELLSKHVPGWRFEPVLRDGVAVAARARMRVRLVATPLANGDYSVSITDSDFPPLAPSEGRGQGPVSIELKRPKYPETPLHYGVSAMAFVVVRVGASGGVEEAWVEQVNLGATADEIDMTSWRKQFAAAVLKAAKASRFEPFLAEGLLPGATSVRIPYSFQINGAKSPTDRPYGQWSAYVPGPRQSAPWLDRVQTGAPDLLAAGEIHSLAEASGLKRLVAP